MEKKNLHYLSYVICLFPILTLIFSTINFNIPYIIGILFELGSSLNDYPLTNLVYKNYCNKEEEYSSFLYNFTGSTTGCSCADINEYTFRQSNQFIVSPGKCTQNQTNNKCSEIDKVEYKKLYSWKSMMFCSKKFNVTGKNDEDGYLRFLKDSVLKNQKCKDGYKMCGKLDNVGNYLCLKESEECPINDIIRSDNLNDTLSNQGYKYYKVGNNYLYYTNTKTEKPVFTQFKASEGKICSDKRYSYTEFPQYILDNNFEFYGCRNKISGSFTEQNVSVLDNNTKEEFYIDNKLNLSENYSNTAEFPFHSLSAEMILYAKNYIGYNRSCIEDKKEDPINWVFNFDSDNISEMESALIDFRALNKVLIVISAYAIVIFFTVSYLEDITEGNNWKNFIIWAIISLIFCFAILVIGLISLYKILKIKNLPICSDEITNQKMKFFNKNKNKFLACSFVIIVSISCQIIWTIILYKLKKVSQNDIDSDLDKTFPENKDSTKQQMISFI